MQRTTSLLERAFGVLRIFSCLELAEPVLQLGRLRVQRCILCYTRSCRKKAGKPTENEAGARCACTTVFIDT